MALISLVVSFSFLHPFLFLFLFLFFYLEVINLEEN